MGANATGRRSGERQAAKEGGDFMLGQRVKQARLAKGLTPAEVAQLGNCGAASAHSALAEEVGSLGAALGVKALMACGLGGCSKSGGTI